MQFELSSDWFPVSRLPAIVPAFGLIWKLMRQMSLGIKCFRGSQVSSTEKSGYKKSKFGELSTEEIQEIKDNAVPVTTKKP